MDQDIKGEEDGPLGKIFRSIASGGRSVESSVDNQLAQKEAQALYDVVFYQYFIINIFIKIECFLKLK